MFSRMSASTSAGLTLLLGPTNSGKMGLVLDWWEERVQREAIVVAPTTPDARELTAEMVRRAGALFGQPPAVTFDGLVNLVLGRAPRYASELEANLVLSEILREAPLEALRRVADLPGTVTALATLLRQLGESGKDGAEVERALTRWAAVEPLAAELASDIRRLAAEQARILAELQLEERPAAVHEAARALRDEAGRVSSSWTRPVALYGFTSFTLGQRLLIEELSRRAEVLLVFTHDGSRGVNLVAPAEISWWQAKAARVVNVSSPARAYDSPAIGYLERYFMGEGSPPAPPRVSADHAGVRFLLASGRRAEAELAAEHVAEFLRVDFRPQEIAVVVRQVSQWGALLRDVFRSCAIPLRVDDRLTLAQTGLGHAFLAALGGVARDDASGILAYLRSPYSGVSLDVTSDLELRYRRGAATGAAVLARIAAGMHLDRLWALWEVTGLHRPPEDGREHSTGDRVPGGSQANFQAQAADALIRNMLVSASRGATVCSEEMEDDARAYRALHQAFLTFGALAARGAPGGLFAYSLDCSAVLRARSGLSVGSSAGSQDAAVEVLSVQRARARRFPVVVVLGLVEGEFPARQQSPSLLSPAQRNRLDLVGGGLFVPEADEESALFVSAVSRASRLLLLSARDAEDDGGQASPSHFWEASRRLLGAEERDRSCRTLADQVFTPETAPTRRHYLRACAALGMTPHASLSLEAPSFPAWERPRPALTSPAVLADLGSADRFSPSALESYLNCPFAWFVERVIGAEELDFELDARLLGQTLHSVLSAAYPRLDSSGLLPLRRESVELAQQVAGTEIEGAVWSEDYPGTVAERRLAACRLKRMTRNLFEMESDAAARTRPVETEMWVGGRKGVDVGGLRILGRIDRVDAIPGGRGLFIIDYKSGSIPAASELGTEKALQLPLYALAVMNERPQVAVLGGVYLSLTERKRAGFVVAGAEHYLGRGMEGWRVFDDAGVEELFQRTREAAQQATGGMSSGIIAPRPDRRCPPWCKLGPACRAQRRGYRP